jgi:hypothetical protein
MTWNQTYTFLGGQTLQGLAFNVNKAVKAHGAPTSTNVTWQQIYQFNQQKIDTLAKQKKVSGAGIANMPMPFGFTVTIPQWIKA